MHPGEDFQTWVSVEDWIDTAGTEHHSRVEQDGVNYPTEAGAVAPARTETRVAA